MHLEFTASALRLLAPCTGSVALLDNHQMVYISGRVIVIYNWMNQTQTFLPPRNSSMATAAFALSPDSQVMATLEVGPKSNLVIYEMMPTRRRKAIPVHVASQHHEEAVALAFSADAKLLATLLPEQLQKEHSHAADLPVSSLNLSNTTTSPTARHQSYSITVYLWRTGKTLASVSLGLPSLPATNPQLSFNPMDVHCMVVVYGGALRFYRLTPDGIENGMKPKLSGHIITCHSWISTSRMALGTKAGQILIIEESDIVTQIPLDANDPRAGRVHHRDRVDSAKREAETGQQMISAVCPIGLNQICHLTGFNLLTVSEARDSKGTVYHTAAVLTPDEPGGASSSSTGDVTMDVGHSSSISEPTSSLFDKGRCSLTALARHGKKFVAVALRGQIWFTELSHHASSENDPVKMENIISLAHSGEIRSLSTAVWRPYAVSVGQDRFLFLWNVAAEQIQFRKHLDEDILCASLHPMGHYVAITTSDSLQVFSVLVDRFHLVREVILAGCRKLAFNSGGNCIAVTRGSTLQLINFITFETSSPLMAHKGEINQIAWSEDGQRIYSCGADGLLCVWDSTSHEVLMQVKPNGNSLIDLAAISNGHLIVASIDGEVVEVAGDGQIVCRLRASELSATSLFYLSREQIILVGTRMGGLRAYKYPINTRSDYQEHFTQYGAITQISETTLGLDGQMLMSCCEDGSICLWRLGDESATATQPIHSSSRKRLEEGELNLECLVLRSDWEDRGKKLDNVIRQLDEVKHQTELQIKAIEQECSQKTYAAESRHHDQFDRAIDKIQELEKKLAQQLEQSHQQMMQLRLDGDNERRRLEEAHHSKLASEYRHHHTLESKIEQLKIEHAKEMDLMEARLTVEQSQRESRLREEYDTTLRTSDDEKAQLKKKVTGLEAALKLATEKFESDQKSFQTRHEMQLSAEKQINLKLRGETAILKKSVNGLQKEVESLRLNGLGQQSEATRLTTCLTSVRQETKELQDELERRDNIIKAKDDKLQKLVLQMQQHDKLQIELKQQLADVKKKLLEGQTEIVKLHCKLQEAVTGSKSAQTEIEQLRRTAEQMQGKAKSQLGELQSLRQKFQCQQGRLQEILVCLDVGMSYLHDARQLKDYFAAIHDVYCDKEQFGSSSLRSSASSTTPSSSECNLLKKVESLENTIASLRHQLSETIKLSEIKQEKLRKDNNLLLSELENTKKKISTIHEKEAHVS
ncbi:LOW QUALITY PROTEIN: cilia- and flagella-associated protein 57 [Daphnia magna]|uniref:LOW QUALITY PROTEIN: cilia- and flagella-associated protein 57 n=1 Tax=Daphnia magna TaxID=35525 RepID=UPI001E1B9F9B|nr:LOW QUALITY PROTEIN: cilia- and flagella-associated protein 57 [Daphnia magna]